MTNPTPHGQVPEALTYERDRAIMEGERNASLDAYSRVVLLTSAESRLYEAAFTNGWNRCAAHVQNPAENEHVAGDVSKNSAKKNMNDYAELPEPDATTVGLGAVWNRHSMRDFADATHALRARQPAPATQQVPQQPCPTCAALARAVMLDQVSFDRKPDCYGIRQITEDEGVEEWEDIRTSPDVAREEANDMMATGRGELYEVVPLWTTPQPSPTAQVAESQPAPVQSGLVATMLAALRHAQKVLNHNNLHMDCGPINAAILAARDPADSVLEDVARLDFLIEQRAYVVSDPDACPGYWLHFVHKETGKCWVQGDEHPTPRAAIDAAMNKGGAA